MRTRKFSALPLALSLALIFGIGYAATTLASDAANAEVPADVKFHDFVDVNFVMEHIKVPMPEDVMIIDSRPKRKKYEKGHIPMAVSIPDSQFDKLTDQLPADKNVLLIFYCGGLKCILSHKSARKAEKLGYTNVKVLAEGYPAWVAAYGKGESAAVASAKPASATTLKSGKEEGSIDTATFVKIVKEEPQSIMLIDVRDANEFKTGSFETAINIPVDKLEDRITTLPTDKPVVFICNTGARSGESFYMVQDVRPEMKNVFYLEAEKQFHKTIHWTWLADPSDKGKKFGKAGYSFNNFCISTNKTFDNSCLSCHPGWGTSMQSHVNCLVCHSQKDMNFDEAMTDIKGFLEEGDEESLEIAGEIQAELREAAQAIGRPARKNCGSCHFYGGGGDGVKHGDLDTSLANPNKTLDVHMGVDGQNFDCTRCHTTTLHNIAGRVYTRPAAEDRKSLIEDDLTAKITCESCHTATPHKSGTKVNDHTDKVVCQSCHIPKFARVNPTKMSWDWSKSGKLKDGKKYKTKDEYGKFDYMSIKGQMKWSKNVTPQYYWYNGAIKSVTAKDKIDPSGVVEVSWPEGDRKDINSRIYPFKVHRGNQPYDKVNTSLLMPLLS